MRRRLAFTLIESLLTMLLVFLVLGIACQLLKEYSGALNFSAGKSSQLTSMQVALQQMVDESRQAWLLVSPVAGPGATDLRFQRFDPAQDWLPQPSAIPTPMPVGYSWSPNPPGMLLEIHYYLTNGNLLRDAGPAGSPPTSSWQVAESVAGLQTQLLSPRVLQIQLSLQSSSVVRVVTGLSVRPAN